VLDFLEVFFFLMTGLVINAELGMDILSPSLVFMMVVLILIFTTFPSYSLPAILTWISSPTLKALSLCTIMPETKFWIILLMAKLMAMLKAPNPTITEVRSKFETESTTKTPITYTTYLEIFTIQFSISSGKGVREFSQKSFLVFYVQFSRSSR